MISKKTQLLAVAVALLIPFGALANDIGAEFEFQDAQKTTTTFVIDGDLSEWAFDNAIVNPTIGFPKIGRPNANGDNRVDGEDPDEFLIHEELGGLWDGVDDQSSSMELVWTAEGLYIGLIVTDDYHENDAASAWNGDSVQMMVTTEDREEDFALYNYALGGIEDDFEVGGDPIPLEELIVNHERGFADFFTDEELLRGDDEAPNVAIVRDTVALTTTYEIFLDAEALGLEEMVEGAKFGIAMSINDGDFDDPGQKGWVGLGAHAIVFGKTSTEAALVTLVEGVVDPTCKSDTQGDIDGNGSVEFADFLVLSANFGNAVDSHEMGDLDCNGTVEFADFLVLSANFGKTVGGAAAVPEPSSLGLFGFSLLLLGFLRRRS